MIATYLPIEARDKHRGHAFDRMQSIEDACKH
jgi:hypothetical protein